MVAKNFGVPAEAFKNIPLHNKWIYQSNQPAPPLETVSAQIAAAAGKPPNSFVFSLADMPPNMVAETLNLDPSVIAQFPKNRPDIMPG